MIRFRRRRHRRTRTTIPVFRASMRQTFWPSVLKVLAIPVLSVAVLMGFGQPALRFQYWYYGSPDYPIFTRCFYLALDGGHMMQPRYGAGTGNACPLVIFVPVNVPALLGWR